MRRNAKRGTSIQAGARPQTLVRSFARWSSSQKLSERVACSPTLLNPAGFEPRIPHVSQQCTLGFPYYYQRDDDTSRPTLTRLYDDCGLWWGGWAQRKR